MQMNRVELAGYVSAKADRLRYLPSGTKVANIRLGESYRYKGKDGQQVTHTNWHALTFYDQLADLAISFEKGDNLFVEGSFQQREFTPADGSKRTVHEVIVKNCHLIAPSRSCGRRDEATVPNGQQHPEISTEIHGDPSWPV
jgi:single-strand DNA-binding protein